MITYATAIKNLRLQVVIDNIDGGSGPGYLLIGTAGLAVELARIDLGNPSFASPSGGQMALLGTPLSDMNTPNSGTAAAAAIYDGDDVLQANGLTVGLAGSGADIIINTLDLVAGQRVNVLSGVIRHG